MAQILLVEFYRAQDWSRHHNQPGSGYYLCHTELPHWAVDSYRMISTLFFGLAVEQMTTDLAKYTIGRLRPHFFTVRSRRQRRRAKASLITIFSFQLCKPMLLDGTTCADYVNEGRYIEEYTCTAKDISVKQFKNMHLSFPSGHSSFVFFSMIYLVVRKKYIYTYTYRCT